MLAQLTARSNDETGEQQMAIGIKGFGKKPDTEHPVEPAPVQVPPRRALAAKPAPRARNRGWMIGGAALVLIAGISAASIVSSLSQSVDVLVAARSIAEGAVITEDDYRAVSIAADTGAIQAIAPQDGERLLGQLASGPIGEGSILHPDQFTNRADQEEEGTIVIGAALGANSLPVLDLLPGDRVRLFETFDGGGFGDDDEVSRVAREITEAEVVATVALNSSGSRHVSMRLNESNGNIVANLIEQDRLSLALIDSLPSTDSIAPAEAGTPLEPGEPGDDE